MLSNLSEPDGEPRTVDLNQLIHEVVESERQSSDDRIEWRVNLGTICPIPGDPAQLRTMLDGSLKTRARPFLADAARSSSRTLTDSRNWVVVTIRDSGCGMSQEVQRRATEPFFSTKPSTPGVGLTIAQVIWRRHRGGLSIESRPGEGTTIQLSIWPPPASPVAPQGEQGPQSSASPTA